MWHIFLVIFKATPGMEIIVCLVSIFVSLVSYQNKIIGCLMWYFYQKCCVTRQIMIPKISVYFRSSTNWSRDYLVWMQKKSVIWSLYITCGWYEGLLPNARLYSYAIIRDSSMTTTILKSIFNPEGLPIKLHGEKSLKRKYGCKKEGLI